MTDLAAIARLKDLAFEDTSWRNNTCPCFFNENLCLGVFIDAANPEDREIEDCPRVTVHHTDADGFSLDGPDQYVQSEDLAALSSLLLPMIEAAKIRQQEKADALLEMYIATSGETRETP